MLRRLHRLVPAALVLALAATAGGAAEKPHLVFLSADEANPATLLPPPTPDDSPTTKAELSELRRFALTTTPARRAQAQWDNDHEDGTIFQSAIAPAFDLAQLPATAHMLAEVRNEEAAAANQAKTYFLRDRPWILDPALKTCSRDDPPQSSYPSGHTTMAFAMAVVLARTAPDLAPQVMRRAEDYAESRMICAAHYRSDTIAGETLGTAVAVLLLRDPKFEADVAAARSELQKAHLAAE